MTKNLFAFLLLVSCSYSSFAQDQTESGTNIEIGIHQAFNLTSLIGNTTSSSYYNREDNISVRKSRGTFDIGIFANVFLSKKFSIQTEVFYTYMGAHMKQTTTVFQDLYKEELDQDVTYALRYVKLPLSFKFYPHEKLFIHAGGYASVLLGADYYYPYTVKEREPIKNVSPYDLGIMAGLGVDLKYLSLGFRYNYGLVDILPDDKNQDLKNSVFQFVLQCKVYRSQK
jgi:hypothetical protein